jgi:hypothetical protein
MDHLKNLVRQDRRVLEEIVPRLRPDELHSVIQSHGLKDCGEIIMLATPEQLTQIFDADLWPSEQFDAERFGEWLQVLVNIDAALAAQKLTEMNADLVIAGLSKHARVLDIAVKAGIRIADDAETCEIGGYCIIARRSESWEAIISILLSLDEAHSDFFHRVMRGCRAQSNAGYEEDVLNLPDEEEQHMFDLFVDREDRREQLGYVAPEQARAFLQNARKCSIPSTPGIAPTGALQTIRAQMKFAREHDESAYRKRSEELSHIANTLISGCPLQGRAFTPQEASNAAVSVCNLGLENLGAAPDDFLAAFQVGWAVLYKEVCMYAASMLVGVLGELRCGDDFIRKDVRALRGELSRWCQAGTPWRARDSMEVIAMLDAPSWCGLVGLIAECPVQHAAVTAVKNPQTYSVKESDFQFISGNRQIASIREFLHTLPQSLQV